MRLVSRSTGRFLLAGAVLALILGTLSGKDRHSSGAEAARKEARLPQDDPGLPKVQSGDPEKLLKRLRAAITENTAALQGLEGRTFELKREIARLRDLLKKIQSSADGKLKPETPTKVGYRPPMRRLTKKKAFGVVCQAERISIVDYEMVTRVWLQNSRVMTLQGDRFRSGRFDLPGSDFEIQVETQEMDRPSAFRRLIVHRKPGCEGESIEQAQQPGSRFRRALESHSPEEYVLEFSVWPDSHHTFRAAREMAWKAGYDVGWEPLEIGELLKLGPGGQRVID